MTTAAAVPVDETRARHRPSPARVVIGLLLTAAVLAAAVTLNGRRAGSGSSGPGDGESNYLVRRGDTSASVAYLHGIGTDRLLEANDLTPSDSIDPGSRLVIPAPPSEGHQPPRELLDDRQKLTYLPYFEAATQRYDLPPGLLGALAWQQSSWVNALVSDDERTGLGQLRPEIVGFLREEVVAEPLDPTRPQDNIELTGAYLGHLLEGSEGDQAATLAGYYLGLETAAPGTWDLDVVEFVRAILRSAPDFAGPVPGAPTTTTAQDPERSD